MGRLSFFSWMLSQWTLNGARDEMSWASVWDMTCTKEENDRRMTKALLTQSSLHHWRPCHIWETHYQICTIPPPMSVAGHLSSSSPLTFLDSDNSTKNNNGRIRIAITTSTASRDDEVSLALPLPQKIFFFREIRALTSCIYCTNNTTISEWEDESFNVVFSTNFSADVIDLRAETVHEQ